METKTAKAIALFLDGKLKQAFRIFKTFSGRLTPNEKRTIEIAYESLAGYAGFYAMLGIDTESKIEEAISIIKQTYAI